MSDEDVYETTTEGHVTGDDLKEFDEFEKKLQDLFIEHGYGTGFYYLMKPINPDWSKNVGTMQWGLIHGVYHSPEILKVMKKHQALINKKVTNIAAELTREELNLLYEANAAVSSMYNSSLSEAFHIVQACQSIITEIKIALGMDHARVVPLKCNKRYFIFTRTGTKYMLRYDEELKYYLKVIEGEGESPPDGPLGFVGMAQESGNIFRREDYPLISTGDKMVFSEHNTTNITFISAEVSDVQEVENLN